MLQFINDLEPHVVGIHATGEVTKEDIENVLMPRIDELVARQGEINYLLVLDTDVQNWTMGAWWNDIKVGLKNFTKWNKIAVVSDQKGVQWVTDAFRFFVPGNSKGFSLAQLDQAVEWINAKEVETIEQTN
ncbi:STAS/SEC14 domain-containing protein [Mucilaginibacter sp. 14171R-50]|uniref:STAS/SEC14 domain-containing protein n=1 Tax=Mucilaginibacter sp. 14171R-50 TaxID=2703789 RepID=UPI00138B7243|nr:STAS/SEC14 domain-containing protein [Mucilaginibacter sp. 14171R-50]QHS56786.1 STAS/SEC14 domain-containing protein [Mucilaginibacter sp. 14171R-50]